MLAALAFYLRHPILVCLHRSDHQRLNKYPSLGVHPPSRYLLDIDVSVWVMPLSQQMWRRSPFASGCSAVGALLAASSSFGRTRFWEGTLSPGLSWDSLTVVAPTVVAGGSVDNFSPSFVSCCWANRFSPTSIALTCPSRGMCWNWGNGRKNRNSTHSNFGKVRRATSSQSQTKSSKLSNKAAAAEPS